MMTEQEIQKEIARLTDEHESTCEQLNVAVMTGDPDGLAVDLENDVSRLEEEIEALEYDLWIVRGRP